MLRAVEMVGGGLLGFIAGSFLCAPLIAHVFSPAVVTWDVSSCPPGIYTITSTATNVESSASFATTTAHVRLPQSSLTQQFSDLPFGQYLISAIARDAKGRTFQATQSLNTPGAASRFRGRQKSAISSASSGGYSPAAAVRSTVAVVRSEAITTAAPVAVAGVAESASSQATSDRFVLPQGIAELLGLGQGPGRGHRGGSLEGARSWRSVTLIDTNEDGVMDAVRIEWSDGEVWVIS